MDQIRREYPHIVQVFKNSRFPPEIVKGLSVALDDFDDRPLIVRSSSLLEDRIGSAFSGKYKSLFLANQGTKSERLAALLDAIAEVYASIFGPDPDRVPRRARPPRHPRGDGHHDPGGGRHARRPLLPAGVRRRRLQQQRVPLVAAHQARGRAAPPGAGPRHARRGPAGRRLPGPDRAGPARPARQRHARRGRALLAAEGRRHQPRDRALRDRGRRRRCWRSAGASYPRLDQIVSVVRRATACAGRLGFDWDPTREHDRRHLRGPDRRSTPFVPRMRALLRLLREKLGVPVDIEFASDGKDLYLLQCRPQSYARGRGAGADPAGRAAGPRPLLGQPLRLERPRARHHAHRLRRSRALRRARRTWPSCATSAAPSAGSTSSCPSASSS